MDERLVAALVTLGMSAAAIAVVALVIRHKRQLRELLSRERLAALDKGVEIPWEMDIRRPSRARRFHLKSGVILLGAGLGLTFVSMLQGTWGDQRDMLSWGIFLVVFGATSILYDRFVGRAEWERTMAMDEALTRAYIRRLEGNGARPDDASAESRSDVR